VNWSVKTLLLASGLFLLLAGCQKQFVRPTPPERCPAIPDPGYTYDELEVWAGRMIDQYTACAAKVDSLHD
jgi:hypothetical protein